MTGWALSWCVITASITILILVLTIRMGDGE